MLYSENLYSRYILFLSNQFWNCLWKSNVGLTCKAVMWTILDAVTRLLQLSIKNVHSNIVDKTNLWHCTCKCKCKILFGGSINITTVPGVL